MVLPPGTTKAWVTPRPAATPRQLVIQGGFVVDDDGRVRRLEQHAHRLGFHDLRSYLQARCDTGHSLPRLAQELGVSDWTVDWYPLFPNPVVAESLLDRLINASHQVFMNGPSYRPNKRPGRVEVTGKEVTR